MNSPFNKVLIFKSTQTKKTPENLIICESPENYNQLLENDKEGLCELIGGENQQIKPIIDIDQYNTDIDIEAFKTDLNVIFPNKEIKYCKRKPRPYNGRMKYSYRVYVQDVRISYINLKQLILEIYKLKTKYDGIDDRLYISNRILYTPNTKYKYDLKLKKYYEVPPLKIMDDAELFECCASYIEESFEDWDLKMPPIEIKKSLKEEIKFNDDLCDNTETSYNGKLNFNEIISKLSKDRATNYNDWFYVGVALINLYYRKIITRGQIYDLFDLFSVKADNYDADSVIKVIDTNINRFDGKGYGIKYLLDCLKVDDNEYYKSITKKDMIISGSNDDIGASEIVINYYKTSLIICKGILYVNDNNVWVCVEKQVDKLLIDMIGKLDIMFYGADGKRQYHYNRSIKHIKDCIVCIKANKTIINDKFYDNMIKNSKYYLPFNDGIYSFKDKKLYTYDELPDIHFTFKINRNFPKYNKTDYDDLMNRVIIPIYPDETERKYNAHIKSRALAGCYEDKKWYGYSGARNSGKGTETGILRSAFGDFVLEFSAKCLIYNKYGNPEPAKALSWVVDKKDARIIISNEIQGDEETKLNGAFIKSLASGGDAMEGRKLYENTVSFIPQFTMFLCYNQFYEVVPADAKENLEQFEYKSRFVVKDELVEGVPFLKLMDETIKEFIKEDRIIDAYTLYILNAFTNPRMKVPESIKNSTEINNGEVQMTVEQFIINNFINSDDNKDRLHTDRICEILNENGYKCNIVETGRLINRIGIGKYNSKCNIDKCKKGGFDFIKYVNETV
jgi:hypothetical protein